MTLPNAGQAAVLSPEQANWRLLVLISGPSGVGKGTIGTHLREQLPDLWLCPSATTRSRQDRDGEGEYLYLSHEEFTKKWDAGQLLEADPHFDDWYGLTNPGPDVLALSDIDVKGSIRLHQAGIPRLLRIAILPPGDTLQEMIEVCTSRMEASRSDPEGIRKRRARAEEEISIIMNDWLADPGATIITNDDLGAAVRACAGTIRLTLELLSA